MLRPFTHCQSALDLNYSNLFYTVSYTSFITEIPVIYRREALVSIYQSPKFCVVKRVLYVIILTPNARLTCTLDSGNFFKPELSKKNKSQILFLLSIYHTYAAQITIALRQHLTFFNVFILTTCLWCRECANLHFTDEAQRDEVSCCHTGSLWQSRELTQVFQVVGKQPAHWTILPLVE